MTEEQLNSYIALVSAVAQLGFAVAGKVKDLIAALHPDVALTEEQLNAIEQAGIADAARRRDEREAMSQAGDGQ